MTNKSFESTTIEEEMARKLFHDAIEYLNINNYHEAEKSLLNASKLMPKKISILNNLVYVYMALDRLEDAEIVIAKALILDSNNIQMLHQLLLLKIRKNELEESIKICNHIELIKNDFCYKFVTASILWEMKNYLACLEILHADELKSKFQDENFTNQNAECKNLFMAVSHHFNDNQFKRNLFHNPASPELLTKLIYQILSEDGGEAALNVTNWLLNNKCNYEYLRKIDIDIHLMLGHEEIAINKLKLNIELDSHSKDSLLYLTGLLIKNSQPKLAAEYCEKYILNNNFDLEIMYSLAVALTECNQLTRAMDIYNKIVSEGYEDFRVFNNLGILYQKYGDHKSALNYFNKSLILKKEEPSIILNKAISLALNGESNEALLCVDQILLNDENSYEAIKCKAKILYYDNKYLEALPFISKSLEYNNSDTEMSAYLVISKMYCMIWDNLENDIENITSAISQNEKGMQPFGFLSCTDSIELQVKCANLQNAAIALPEDSQISRILNDNKKIKIGFVSPDFNDHPVSYLLRQVIGSFDRSKFEVVGIYVGDIYEGVYYNDMKKLFDNFLEIDKVGKQKIYETVLNLNLDVAIDLAGHTANGAPYLFLKRISNIQINFLGFPGTMGEKYCDYIVADKYTIPENLSGKYPEKILYMPDSFQPNDSSRIRPFNIITKSSAGLPDDKLIFCAFNSSRKILPKQFDLWMKILSEIPNSVLWLSSINLIENDSVHSKMKLHSISSERVILAPRMPVHDYLSCLSLADLFLDTYPFNAGTTCSDALWMGLPVLTLSGETFASRMAGSLLTSLGLTEFIANSYDEYFHKAKYFGSRPEELKRVKHELLSKVADSNLYNGKVFARNFENKLIDIVKNQKTNQI